MASNNKKPLRILHVFSSLSRGGVETWLMEIMRLVDRSELEMDAFLVSEKVGPYEQEFLQLGGRVYHCLLRRNLFAFIRDFRRILREGKYDVLQAHAYYASGFFLRIASNIDGLRLIAHLYPTADIAKDRRIKVGRPLYRWLMKRWINRYADTILGCSQATLDNFWGPTWRESSRIRVLPIGVNIASFEEHVDRSEVLAKLGLPTNARIVLTVGRYAPHKNQIIIPEIAAQLCQEDPDVYFVLIGAGPMREAVEKSVTGKGLQKRFRFISGAPSLIPFWKSADVFLFPSLMEGFGIVITEAAAAGIPIAAYRIQGVEEAASASHNAILLPVGMSTEKWVEAVKQALRVGRLTADALDKLRRNFRFTIQNSLSLLRDVYGV